MDDISIVKENCQCVENTKREAVARQKPGAESGCLEWDRDLQRTNAFSTAIEANLRETGIISTAK
jgi:hypothetical protein